MYFTTEKTIQEDGLFIYFDSKISYYTISLYWLPETSLRKTIKLYPNLELWSCTAAYIG